MKTLKLIAFFLVLAAWCAAQTPAAMPTGPVVIDGAQNPSAISDATALRMFFAMTAVKATPAASTLVGPQSAPATLPQTITSFLDQLKQVNDKTVLTQHINSWAAQNLAQTTATATTASVNADAETRLKQLKSTLSPDGWKALTTELTRRKAHIKIYEYPDMGMGPMPMK
jgi:hypothetical protein